MRYLPIVEVKGHLTLKIPSHIKLLCYMSLEMVACAIDSEILGLSCHRVDGWPEETSHHTGVIC